MNSYMKCILIYSCLLLELERLASIQEKDMADNNY